MIDMVGTTAIILWNWLHIKHIHVKSEKNLRRNCNFTLSVEQVFLNQVFLNRQIIFLTVKSTSIYVKIIHHNPTNICNFKYNTLYFGTLTITNTHQPKILHIKYVKFYIFKALVRCCTL